MNVELCHNYALNVQGFIIIEIPPNSTVSIIYSSSIYNGTNCEEIIYLTGDTNCYIKLNNFF